MLPVGLVKQEQPELPRITWTDLVFRPACPKPYTKVATTEAGKSGGSSVAVSKRYPERSGCRLDKKNQKAKSSPPRLDYIQEDVVGETQGASPPNSYTVNPPSAPKSVAFQEKRAVRRILVDLRPILETLTEPFSSQQEDPARTDPGQEDPAETDSPQEDPARTDSPQEDPAGTDDEGLSQSAGDSSSEDLAAEVEENSSEAPAINSRDGGVQKAVLLPSIVDLGKASSLAAAKTPRVSQLRLREPTPLPENDSPPSPVPEPRIRTPISFPKITPLQEVERLETDCSREPERSTPAAPSPDFQLPTQLLLRKLQETTTSKDHLLIAQALRRLRKELMADYSDSGDGDKSNPLPVLSRSNIWQSRTTDGRPKELNPSPEAAKRRHQLICRIGRVQPKAKQPEIKQTRLFGSSKPGQAHSLPAEAVATPIKQVQLDVNTTAAVK